MSEEKYNLLSPQILYNFFKISHSYCKNMVAGTKITLAQYWIVAIWSSSVTKMQMLWEFFFFGIFAGAIYVQTVEYNFLVDTTAYHHHMESLNFFEHFLTIWLVFLYQSVLIGFYIKFDRATLMADWCASQFSSACHMFLISAVNTS